MEELHSLMDSTSDEWVDAEPLQAQPVQPRAARTAREADAEKPAGGVLSRLPGRSGGDRPKKVKTPGPAGADAWNRPRPLWMITLIAVAVCVLLSLIIGFATKGISSGGNQPADQGQQVASAVDLSGGATSSTVLTAMQSGELTWNNNQLTYTSPSATVVAGEVNASASFVDCNTSIEQAVALATACFADPQITKLTFTSLSSEGNAEVKIEIEASQTPVASLADMQKGSPEQTYGKVAAYTISESALAASGYHAIEATGGTGLTPATTADEGSGEGEGESEEGESESEDSVEY